MEIFKGLILFVVAIAFLIALVSGVFALFDYSEKLDRYKRVKNNAKKYKDFKIRHRNVLDTKHKSCDNCVYGEKHCTLIKEIEYTVCLRGGVDDVYFPEHHCCARHRFDISELEKELFNKRIRKR